MEEKSKYEAPLWTSVVSGTVGGAVGVVVGFPFESVKVRLQTGKKSKLFGSLYKGIAAPLIAVTPQWAVMYGSYFFSQSWLEKLGFSDNVTRGALSGAFCGLIVATITAPSDAVKIIAQNERISAFKALGRLIERGGLRSITHGLFATSLHFGVSQAIFFATYEYILWKLGAADASGSTSIDWRPALAGGLSGIVEWTTCMSTDTIKTRLQAGPVGVSYISVVRNALAESGLRGLYRGYFPSMLRAVPVNASAYFFIEVTNRALLQTTSKSEHHLLASSSPTVSENTAPPPPPQ